jgi:hypothetical protein
MITKQYKAKGPVTNTLLPVVAMDDAVALLAFGLSMALIKVLGSGSVSVLTVLRPLFEILAALLFGAVLGILLTQLVKIYTGRGNRLALTIAFVFICCGTCEMLDWSSLLSCMMMSCVFANTSRLTASTDSISLSATLLKSLCSNNMTPSANAPLSALSNCSA